jgi:hypothetical protein
MAAPDTTRHIMDTAFGAQLKTIWSNLGEVVGLIALSILAAFSGKIKAWWKDRSVKRFESRILDNVRVRDLLAEIRVLYSADRVYLMQLHNGDVFLSGESAMKCSLTHIVLNDGVALPSEALNQMQNLPTGCYISALQKMKSQGSFFCQPGHGPDDPFLQDKFAKNGTKSAWYAAVRDARGNWISFLAIEWLDGVSHPKDEDLAVYCSKIGAHLSKI